MASTEEPTKPLTKYEGNCHCRAVRFNVSVPSLEEGHRVTNCNCSICKKNGYLLVYPEAENIEWLAGKDDLKTYKFGTKQAQHFFCPTCGSSVAIIWGGKWGLNTRMIKGVDVDKLEKRPFDGWGKLGEKYE